MGPLNLFWAQLILSSDILQTMNETANPCDDFYEFACGNYPNKVKLPEEEASFDSFVEVGKKINKQLRGLLEAPIDKNDTKSAKLAKTHYKACMNVSELEKLGLQPWKAVIDGAGGWPILTGSSWKEDDYDWMATFAKLFRLYGVMAIVSFDVGTDSKNSSRRILEIDQTGLGLGGRDYYLEKNQTRNLEAYKEYMVNTAIQLGADKKTAEKDVHDLIQFETQLANITVKDEDRTNFTELYNLVSIGELKKRYPEIPLHTFFDDMIKHGWKINDSADINIAGDPYLEKLPEILNKTSKRVLANYQMWDIVRGYEFYIAPSLKDNYRKFRGIKYGINKDKERWEECVDATFGDWTLAVSSMFVKHYFQNDAKAEMDQLVANVRKEMVTTLTQTAWMDASTRETALKKMSQLIEKIGYPPYIYNETRILLDKELVELREDRFMENAVTLSKTEFNSTKRIYSMPVNRSDWGMSAAEVNAEYSLARNDMTFPAGILQYPFFAPYAPVYVNYGRIGSIIGHEITHGYDDQGRQFGGDGNLQSWWSEKTLENFTNGSKCFINQYGKIKDKTTGYKLNGELELGENIADNGGVKLAYKAYRLRFDEKVAKNHSLQGLTKYTPDQLFFISYGQVWCEIIRKETLEESIITNVHAPNKYRYLDLLCDASYRCSVNVPLQNFPVFAQAFDCPKGSFMNPEKKCSIW